MTLSIRPPLVPMLARLTRELPAEPGYCYEPKWDGFRCLAFCDGADVDLRSRNDRPLSRYFPEVVEALRSLAETPLVLDGELVLLGNGEGGFAALMSRLHPAASRVTSLSAQTPATYIAFDVLEAGDDNVMGEPFDIRRRRLESLIEPSERVTLTPATDDPSLAGEWLVRPPHGAMDGVMAKPVDGTYQPGRRAIVKVKRERTADVVVAGVRLAAEPLRISSLLLGVWEGTELRHVGVCQSFTARRRLELLHELQPLAVTLDAHPWQHGFALEGGPTGRLKGAAGRWMPGMTIDWVPLEPTRVAEVAYDQLDGIRFRHPARFVRWRPDRDSASCTVDQLAGPDTDTIGGHVW